MSLTIIDLEGKEIKVTNLQAAIDQVKCYTTFSGKDSRNNKYWEHTLAELKKLKEPKPVVIETVINGKELPQPVIECRKVFGNKKDFKGYIKNDKSTPLYGLHSCAKSPRILAQIEALEIGESVNNSTPRKITRVY